MDQLGSADARVALYLENRPIIDREALNTAAIIAINGNHWRKILTIWAKLVTTSDWRDYRDNQLLQVDEQLVFNSELAAQAVVHIFSGKACWQRFAINDAALAACSASRCGRAFYRESEQGLLLYTPYFDYRQLPNALIDELRPIIKPYLKN